jgi:hypothetical protein
MDVSRRKSDVEPRSAQIAFGRGAQQLVQASFGSWCLPVTRFEIRRSIVPGFAGGAQREFDVEAEGCRMTRGICIRKFTDQSGGSGSEAHSAPDNPTRERVPVHV